MAQGGGQGGGTLILYTKLPSLCKTGSLGSRTLRAPEQFYAKRALAKPERDSAKRALAKPERDSAKRAFMKSSFRT